MRAVRKLILEGLQDRWGVLDASLNRDLDDFTAAYGAGVTLTSWRGQRLVGTGTLVPREPGTGEVLRMSAAAERRRLGIASRFQRPARGGPAAGTPRHRPGGRSSLDRARSLYERHGFVLDREEDGEFCRDAFYYLRLDE